MSHRLEQLLDELEDEVNQLAGQLGEKIMETVTQLKATKNAIDELTKANVIIPTELQAAYDRLEATSPSDSIVESAENALNRLHKIANLLQKKIGRSGVVKQIPSGPTTAPAIFKKAILEILNESGNSVDRDSMFGFLESRINLTDADLEQLKDGRIRWKNRVRGLKSRLTEQGLLASNCPPGHWKLNENTIF